MLVEGGDPGRLSLVAVNGGSATLRTLKEGFPDNAVAATVIGQTAYVAEAQWRALHPDPSYTPKPFHATAVPITKH